MKHIKFFFGFMFALLLTSFYAIGQTDLISAADFMALKKANKDLVILDASKAKIFNNAHVKNAIHINHNDLYQDGEVKGLIMSIEELADFFAKMGISENSEIVIYDDGSQKYSSRVYWVLEYLGAENVKILHKDMDDWRKARIPLTTVMNDPKPVTFTANVNSDLFVTKDELKTLLNASEFILIDARTADEYLGTADNSDGHLPGAINLDYKDLLLENGAFKSKNELMAIAENLGITPDKQVVAYCRTSVRATVLFVAFRNILGYENVKVYDGAYLEWIVDNPIIQ